VEPSLMGNELLVKYAEDRVDRVIRLLHLESCSNTLARALRFPPLFDSS
jgi:hypothetical protein